MYLVLTILFLENIHSFILSFLSIQLLKELLQPLHLTYTLLPFLFINFSSLNSFLFFPQFFFYKSFQQFLLCFRSLTAYAHGTVFLTFLNTNTSSDLLQNSFYILIFLRDHFEFRTFFIIFVIKVKMCLTLH